MAILFGIERPGRLEGGREGGTYRRGRSPRLTASRIESNSSFSCASADKLWLLLLTVPEVGEEEEEEEGTEDEEEFKGGFCG